MFENKVVPLRQKDEIDDPLTEILRAGAKRLIEQAVEAEFAAFLEPQAECMLVLIGATPEGKKELLGFRAGMRESAQSWKELLVDLKARGLSIAPEIAVGDGALGFWRALDEAFPSTRHQRC